MPVKLSITVNNINTVTNTENQMLIAEFYEFMKASNTSEKYQNNNLKTVIAIGKFWTPEIFLSHYWKKANTFVSRHKNQRHNSWSR